MATSPKCRLIRGIGVHISTDINDYEGGNDQAHHSGVAGVSAYIRDFQLEPGVSSPSTAVPLGDGDIVSYASSDAAVSVDLDTGMVSGGHAEGDTIDGFSGVVGSTHGDILAGDDEANLLSGGDGNDTLIGRDGIDTLDGGSGTDLVSLSDATSGVTVDFATGSGLGDNVLVSIEGVEGSNFADSLVGSSDGDLLIGADGDDSLSGGQGDDTLEGGAGADVLRGGTSFEDLSQGLSDFRTWNKTGVEVTEATEAYEPTFPR
jgi:Ca2+-binding RTX toxin-like protein